MTKSEPYKLDIHPLFAEYVEDPAELFTVADRFINGDCGDLSDEGEILGFMRRGLSGNARYAFYDTKTCGRVHVMGKNPEILLVPDLVYATDYRGIGRELNTCNCPACTATPETQPNPTTNHGNS